MSFHAKLTFQRSFGGNWQVVDNGMRVAVAPADINQVTGWLERAQIDYKLQAPGKFEKHAFPYHQLTLTGDAKATHAAIANAIAQGANPPPLFAPPSRKL